MGGSFGIPDPDVTRVRIEVELRTLRMDNMDSLSGREPYIHFYTTHRDFPGPFDEACDIPLDFRDIPVLNFGNLADFGGGLTQAAIDAADELPLPTARDIRLTIRAVANDDAAYFANEANIGKPLQIKVRQESADERELIASSEDSRPLSAAGRLAGLGRESADASLPEIEKQSRDHRAPGQ